MDASTPPTPLAGGSDPTQLLPDDGVAGRWSDSFALTQGDDPTATVRGVDTSSGAETSITLKAHRVSDESTDPEADFQLLDILGEGGMGVVYAARQTAIDRTVAVKMLRGESVDDEARERFLAEAVVTGGLEHPNIVPVHDLGTDRSGAVFFAMKRVDGRTWRACLGELSLREHLDVLLRVCDAIAFAHSQGVIHRDLKPGNVMLGSFGEVQVMDWGLAVAVGEQARGQRLWQSSPLAGTPAYMAPEMATGDADAIGESTDVYLLGACLWEVLTGRPPHQAATRREAVVAAFRNDIAPAPGREGELHALARRAMAAKPDDRFPSVLALQHALRDHLGHAESLRLAELAAAELAAARDTAEDERFQRARHGFEQALTLWGGNAAAAAGAMAAREAYAAIALTRGDLDLAASLAAPLPERELADRITAAQVVRRQREHRSRLLARLATGLAAALVVGGLVAYAVVRHERDRAEDELARRLELERERDGRLAAIRREAEAATADGSSALARADGTATPLIAAQAAFRRALFLDPTLAAARDGMRHAALAHADLALAVGAWDAAREKVDEAAAVGLPADEHTTRRAAIDAAAGARHAHIAARVTALMDDATADTPLTPPDQAQAELIALADPFTAGLLLERLSDSEPARRRLAIGALAWMGGPAALPRLLERIGGPGDLDEQAAAFAAVCALAPRDASVFHSLRDRLNRDGLLTRGRLWTAVAPAWRAYAGQVVDAIAEADAGTSSPIASRDYGMTYLELERWAEAERWLHLSHRVNRENALPVHHLVAVRLKQGNHAGAAEAAGALTALPGLRVHGLLQRAMVWRASGDRVREDADLDAAQAAAPSDPAVHRARAESALARGLPGPALAALDRSLALLPNDETRLVRAGLRLDLGDAAGALDDLLLANQLVASRPAALVLRAQARWRLRDGEGAQLDAQAALRLAPGRADARVVTGLVRAEAGDLAGADEAARQAGSHPGAEAVRALAARAAGDAAGELAAWDRAIAADPRPDWLAGRAAAHAAAGRHAAALADADAACAARPLDPALRGRRGAVRLAAGHAEAAVADLRAAVAGEPGHHRHWTNLGWALAQLGDDDAALTALDRAIAIAPDDAQARRNRATVRERRGDAEGVRDDLDALLLHHRPTVDVLQQRAAARERLGDTAGAAADRAAAAALGQ